MEKAAKAANVADVDATRGGSSIELLNPLTDMCTMDVDLPKSTSDRKRKRGGQATVNANSSPGLATWLTTATNSRLSRLNKDRSRILRVRNRLTMALPHRHRHPESLLRGRHPSPNSSPAQPKCAATRSGAWIAMPMSILCLIATASLPIVSSIVQSRLRDGMGLWILLLALDPSTLLARVDADIDCPKFTMLRWHASSC